MMDERELAANLLLGSQAPCANVDPLPFSVYDDGGLADIRQPAPLGMALGMGYIISNQWFLSTQLALQRLSPLTKTLFSCRIHLKI
jgi:hypothetical protein